jgi:hypothetical protein
MPILWRPPGLDPEIAYSGPKPLNLDGSPHDRCAFGTSQKKSGDPIIDSINYTKELAFFLHHGYPCLQSHYDRCYSLGIGIQQACGDPDCQCARVEALKQKDPLIKEEWNRQRAEWLKKWR